MRKLLAVLAILAVTGCSTDAPAERAGVPSGRTPEAGGRATTSASTLPTPGVSAAAPAGAYLLKRRLHVQQKVLPGRFVRATARGDAWIAWPAGPGRVSWGVNGTPHRLPPGQDASLSNSGRYLAAIGTGASCFNVGEGICRVRFLETSGKSPERRLDLPAPYGLVGVTDDGTVLLMEYAGGQDLQLWHAARGDSVLTPARLAPGQPWALSISAWDEGSLGLGGYVWRAPNTKDGYGPEERWLGDVVGNQVRPRFRIPEDVELGPGGRWLLGTAWTPNDRVRDLKGALEPTTPTLRVRTLGKRGKLGAPVLLKAPNGWFFARATPFVNDVVFWEDSDTFIARVVDSRQGGDRLARCDLPLETCVLVGGSP